MWWGNEVAVWFCLEGLEILLQEGNVDLVMGMDMMHDDVVERVGM